MESIFKWFTLEDSAARIDWFTNQLDCELFKGVDKVLYLFLRYCTDLGIPGYRQYFDAYLRTEGKTIIRKHSIRLEVMDSIDYNDPIALEEAYQVIQAQSMSAYDLYTQLDIDGHEFKVDMSTYLRTQMSERLQYVMSESFASIAAGQDTEEVADMLEYEIARAKIAFSTDSLHTLDFLEGRQSSKAENKNAMRHLFKTTIPCIDGDSGGVFSTQVWSLTGSPGSGKSRIAACYWAYQAAVVGKLDVLFDELELKQIEVENMLIAHHIIHLYGGKVKIPDSLMNKGLLTPEQERYYQAARIDLFESGKYGKITIRTGDLIVESLGKNMFSFLRRNKNTQFWVIDYAGLAKSKPLEKYTRAKDAYEIIQELYKTAKEIAKIADIGVLIINQFNREGVAAAQAGKRIMAGHVQGGMIVEQHADYDLAICRTEEQEIANMCTMSTVKKRAAAGFQNVPFSTDLSVTILRQIDTRVA